MKRETAEKIVKDFFNQMNPEMWSGNGNRPTSFDDRALQYPLTNEVNLEITFVNNEEDGWCHYCDLVYESDNSSFDMLRVGMELIPYRILFIQYWIYVEIMSSNETESIRRKTFE